MKRVLLAIVLTISSFASLANTTETALSQLIQTREELAAQIQNIDRTIDTIRSQYSEANVYMELERFYYGDSPLFKRSTVEVRATFTGIDVGPSGHIEIIANGNTIKRVALDYHHDEGHNFINTSVRFPERTDLNQGIYQIRYIAMDGSMKTFTVSCRGVSDPRSCQ